MLSIVIPALDAAATLGRTIEALRPLGADEVVVVDGGSRDATGDVARALGARVIQAPRRRAVQLAPGAAAARGGAHLFPRGDTRLAPRCREAAAVFLARPDASDRAGYFRFRLDDDAPAARRLERIVAWRARVLGLPYGDQGLLIGRAFYAALGGFPPIPLMEDVALVRRIGRRRLVALDADAVTSAARYRRDGYLLRPARNLLCLGLYFAGLPPRRIAALYR